MKFNFPPIDKKTGLLNVVIETPRGSSNKFAFDEQLGIFRIKRALPAGMMFPLDFGFLPKTLGGDGDPLDVLVIQPYPGVCGCCVRAKILGVIEANEHRKKQMPKRNDRIIVIAETDVQFEHFQSYKDLPAEFLHDISEFFKNYHALDGTEFQVLRIAGPKQTTVLIDKGRKDFRKSTVS